MIESQVRAYLKEFQFECEAAWNDGSTSTEMATRPLVHNFVKALAQDLAINQLLVRHDTAISGTGNTPDWRIYDLQTDALFTFGDQKNFKINNSRLKLTATEEKQIERYRRLSDNVFVFDGIRMLIYSAENEYPQEISLLLEKPASDNQWDELAIDHNFFSAFGSYFDSPSRVRYTEELLIKQVAFRSISLREIVLGYLDSFGGAADGDDLSQTIHCFTGIQQELSEHHSSVLEDSVKCADFIAQVLSFGLLYAHSFYEEGDESPEQRLQDLRMMSWASNEQYISSMGIFSELSSRLLKILSLKTEFSYWINEISQFFSFAGYIRGDQGLDFHTLFELFLHEYDPKMQFEMGAFYTPKNVSDWMVRATFNFLPQSDSSEKETIKIIDPCCGTGSFIESFLDRSERLRNTRIEISGFEIMPAPYALAHSRVTQHSVFSSTEKDIKVSILLTDTLSDRLKISKAPSPSAFESELIQATQVSRPPVTCVIGNPPSTKSPSSTQRKILDSLMEDFRPPAARRTGRSNIQKTIRYESYNFLRWSAQEIISSGEGVLSLVLPSSFLSSSGLQWARKWIEENFTTVLVLNLDEDLRTGTSQGQSIFKVRQGRAILIAELKSDKNTKTGFSDCATVFFKDISRYSLKEKNEYLDISFVFSSFSQIDTSNGFWEERTPDSRPSDWEQYWPLTKDRTNVGIFNSTCSGVKNGLTAPLVHTDINVLKTRTMKISRLGGRTGEIINDWFRGQRKLPREQAFSSQLLSAFGSIYRKNDAYTAYNYRPFLRAWTISDDNVRSAVKSVSSGARFRPEIVAAFSQNALGIAVSSSPPALGHSLTRLASFVWNLPDNDIVARGSARIHCDIFPEEKTKSGAWSSSPKNNISTEFLNFFSGTQEALFYVYAVISSNSYLRSNEENLFRNFDSENQIRIPLYSDENIRGELVSFGQRIAAMEDFSSLPKDLLVPEFPHEINDKLIKSQIDVGDSCVRLQFEQHSDINIPVSGRLTLSHRISGHDVVATWLRERQFSYLRRNFTQDDGNGLLELLARLSAQISLIDELDFLLGSTDLPLVVPSSCIAGPAATE